MERNRTREAHLGDFFQIHAPALAVERALSQTSPLRRGCRALVFDLQRRRDMAREVRVAGEPVAVVPFPYASIGLVDLALDTARYNGVVSPNFRIYLPRRPFNQVADNHGAQRISDLALDPGAAVGDHVLFNLGACLEHAVTPAKDANSMVVDQVASALNAHIAQRYGGMRAPNAPSSGGLSPWQLRLARNAFDEHLDGAVSLQDLANACGLSISHFSRAFTRSTGVAPHRWLMQRRIEVAKDLIREGCMPLVEVAIACGFSDQSHLTRAFARAAGQTPGRWRSSQKN